MSTTDLRNPSPEICAALAKYVFGRHAHDVLEPLESAAAALRQMHAVLRTIQAMHDHPTNRRYVPELAAMAAAIAYERADCAESELETMTNRLNEVLP
ncbi:MAG: hypothetical protein DI635_00725 [Pseudoxanthomonas suwonensis]|nr:MAG: hypothetical protein DI635_00725 [Pseudoxanthomonas suwonensis]